MGYCIEDFIHDSGFAEKLVDHMQDCDEDDYISEYLLDELERISSMSTPFDSDRRFYDYKNTFTGMVIRSMVGGRDSDTVSTGEIILEVFKRLNDSNCEDESFISFKYKDGDGIVRTYVVDDSSDEY